VLDLEAQTVNIPLHFIRNPTLRFTKSPAISLNPLLSIAILSVRINVESYNTPAAKGIASMLKPTAPQRFGTILERGQGGEYAQLTWPGISFALPGVYLKTLTYSRNTRTTRTVLPC